MALTKLATGNFYNNNPDIISFVNAYTITEGRKDLKDRNYSAILN